MRASKSTAILPSRRPAQNSLNRNPEYMRAASNLTVRRPPDFSTLPKTGKKLRSFVTAELSSSSTVQYGSIS